MLLSRRIFSHPKLVLGPLPIVCVVPTSCSAMRCVVSTGILWSDQSGVRDEVVCDIPIVLVE